MCPNLNRHSDHTQSLIATIILGLALMLRKKLPVADEPELETELCPKCGFDIEKGTKCPFCPEEKPPLKPKQSPPKQTQKAKPTLPKPTSSPPQKLKFSKEEMLERLEKAFKDGKMTEEQYLRNLEKFK